MIYLRSPRYRQEARARQPAVLLGELVDAFVALGNASNSMWLERSEDARTSRIIVPWPALSDQQEPRVGRLHVTQIQDRLSTTVMSMVDVSDIVHHHPDELARTRNSRSLAAFIAMKMAGVGADDAAASVVDGAGDNGIDAIVALPDEARLIVIQSKWAEDSRGSVSLDDVIKFRDGVNDLVQLKWDRFNSKLQPRIAEIQSLLLVPSIKIEIVLAHMGTGEMSEEARTKMDDFLDDLNDPSETADFYYFNQGRIHQLLIDESAHARIDLVVELSDWGLVDGPPSAVYGQVTPTQVARWMSEHGSSILAKNVRVVLPDSEVNQALVETIVSSPEKFWYYNNGITVLCEKIEKAPAGGADRRVGTFSFVGVTVVNGAQTAGSLGKALAQGRTGQLDAAKVMVRFISLESTGDAFATEVTRATNTQNRIGGRDFVSLDREQRRIRDEFAVEGLQYVYRSGESDPESPDRGCSVVQATVALACAGSAALATQAKREISRLWDDIGRAPYKQLFKASTSYLRVWRCVQVMRVVDTEISRISAALDGREKGIAVHGNRLVLHLVFRQLPLGEVENPGFNWDSALVGAKEIVPVTLAAVINVAEADYPGYPASLFKNATKVGELSAKALAAVGAAT